MADFLPRGYVKDGSVSYQKELQKALDAAAQKGGTLVFPAGIYRLDESGLQLRSHLTLWLYGAVFRLDAECSEDGQALPGTTVSPTCRWLGGEIRGPATTSGPRASTFAARPSHRGKTARVRFRDAYFHDLSSNGIGVFADPTNPARDVWVVDVVIAHCCNRYGDYLSKKPGPEKGSVRADQGLIAFYYVQDFLVRGCRGLEEVAARMARTSTSAARDSSSTTRFTAPRWAVTSSRAATMSWPRTT